MHLTRARFAAKAACVVLCSSLLTAPQGVWAQTAAPAMTADQSATALAGAQSALLSFAHSKSMAEVVDHMTDRSVGVFGIIFTIPIAFGIGFSQMGATPDKPSSDPTLQKDFNDFLTRYLGDPKPDKPITGLPETLKGHEREFVTKLTEFETRLDKMSKDGGKDDGFQFSQAIPTDFTKYTFSVVSPTEVKITPKKGNTLKLPGVVSISAMQEDGQWRLDLGDPAVILNAMSKSMSPGKPSDPPANPLADKMIEAAKSHDIPAIKALLHKDPKLVDAQDFMGESALYNTVFWEDVPTAAFLIAHGAKVNAPNHMGQTPLDEAVFFHRTKMIALLKKHGGKTTPKKKSASN
ncbi:hypothetical protein CCAX7_15740 [Capsulimonas corticalis]|uniref:Uncharacterized protein n=1 Tax=Capsulimonas corticalis TaxID=2219043 RepID=A0A402CZ87_9BACT|nr:ankyrin repeat domain-containing protein [Capsulimonas corticalis]BDI29523.1 hypothetical protein CCAX7_15740 [Capsulimonas corticalis]